MAVCEYVNIWWSSLSFTASLYLYCWCCSPCIPLFWFKTRPEWNQIQWGLLRRLPIKQERYSKCCSGAAEWNCANKFECAFLTSLERPALKFSIPRLGVRKRQQQDLGGMSPLRWSEDFTRIQVHEILLWRTMRVNAAAKNSGAFRCSAQQKRWKHSATPYWSSTSNERQLLFNRRRHRRRRLACTCRRVLNPLPNVPSSLTKGKLLREIFSKITKIAEMFK